MMDETLEKLKEVTDLNWRKKGDIYFVIRDPDNSKFNELLSRLNNTLLPFTRRESKQGTVITISSELAEAIINPESSEVYPVALNERLNQCTGIEWKLARDINGIPKFTNVATVLNPQELEDKMRHWGIELEYSAPDMSGDLHLKVRDALNLVENMEWQGVVAATHSPQSSHTRGR